MDSKILLACTLAAACLLPAAAPAQTNAGDCIIAGRLNENGRWAPRMQGVQLLAPKARVVRSPTKEALGDVQQVRLSQPALLARCDGDGEVAHLDDVPALAREPVPALARGVYDVDGVSFPKLRRGGELVELRIRVPSDRIVMLKR